MTSGVGLTTLPCQPGRSSCVRLLLRGLMSSRQPRRRVRAGLTQDRRNVVGGPFLYHHPVGKVVDVDSVPMNPAAGVGEPQEVPPGASPRRNAR